MSDPEELLDHQNYDDIVVDNEENKDVILGQNQLPQEENQIVENHEDTFASIEIKPKEDHSQNKTLELENTIQPELLDERDFRDQNETIVEKHSHQDIIQDEEKVSDKTAVNISTHTKEENKESQTQNHIFEKVKTNPITIQKF
jgi:hypothetical protein